MEIEAKISGGILRPAKGEGHNDDMSNQSLIVTIYNIYMNSYAIQKEEK